MCGIVCVLRKDGKPAFKQVIKRYNKQKYRGSEGFGFITLDKAHKVKDFLRYQNEKEATTELQKMAYSSILFHHRYPTSTPNIPESAHPIKVQHAELLHDYYVVHNGVITNDDDMRDKHIKLGYKYSTDLYTSYVATNGKSYHTATTFNDSEALAIELARAFEGLSDKVEARGAIAYIALQVDKTTHKTTALYFGHNDGNPLTVTDTPNGITIASEGGKDIDEGSYRMDLDTNDVVPVNITIPPFYEPKKSIGYTTHAGDSYGGEYELPVKGASLDELEEAIEDKTRFLDEIEADLHIAVGAGEVEEADDLKQLKGRELAKLYRLQNEYDDKTSTIPF